MFTQIIHRLMHRTLTLHPRDWRDRSMLSCWSRVLHIDRGSLPNDVVIGAILAQHAGLKVIQKLFGLRRALLAMP